MFCFQSFCVNIPRHLICYHGPQKNVTLQDEEMYEGKLNSDNIFSGTCINVDPSITVSHIRSVKLDILEIGNALVSSIAFKLLLHV